jgi:four helix bundle protein
MPTFEDLEAFKRALALTVHVYRSTESFPRTEIYGLTAQVRKASISVLSHLAEGQGRLTDGEWRQFLSQARGSLFEVQAQVIAAHELHFLSDAEYTELRKSIAHTAKPLQGLIDWVRKREAESRRRPKPDKQ